jgi:hypothetical protein
MAKRGFVVEAIWDTGATCTFVSDKVREELGIVPVEYQPVTGLNGTQMTGLGLLSIKLSDKLIIPDKRVFICNLPSSIEMLIGMDIIQLGDFCITNNGNKTTFTFVTPSLPASKNLLEEAELLNEGRRKEIVGR